MFSPSPAIPWKFIGTSCFHIVKIHNDMHLLGFIFICWAGYSVAYSSFLGMLLNFLFCSPPILVSLSCYKKKNTPTSWLNFHSFRSWKSKFKAPADSAAREGPVSGFPVLLSHCVLTWQKDLKRASQGPFTKAPPS